MDPPRVGLKLDLRQVRSAQTEPDFLKPMPGRLHFPSGESYDFTAADLIEGETIGTGSYGGVVTKMIHRQSGTLMAVKRVRAHEIDTKKREQMLRELKIIIQSQNCEDVVRFYGALFQDGDCWITMELMDTSLEHLYLNVYAQQQRLPEKIVGFITAAVVRALRYLKVELNIIHRDVKPSNILLDRQGFVKICDFGISGYLVDSIARTQDVGCQIYLAPERFSPAAYNIKSDVWSLGISLVEICIGHFPFKNWNTVFDQIQAVVNGDPPFLQADFYSLELCAFVNSCLVKETTSRPSFDDLMQQPFFERHNVQGQEAVAAARNECGTFVGRFVKH